MLLYHFELINSTTIVHCNGIIQAKLFPNSKDILNSSQCQNDFRIPGSSQYITHCSKSISLDKVLHVQITTMDKKVSNRADCFCPNFQIFLGCILHKEDNDVVLIDQCINLCLSSWRNFRQNVANFHTDALCFTFQEVLSNIQEACIDNLLYLMRVSGHKISDCHECRNDNVSVFAFTDDGDQVVKTITCTHDSLNASLITITCKCESPEHRLQNIGLQCAA